MFSMIKIKNLNVRIRELEIQVNQLLYELNTLKEDVRKHINDQNGHKI